MKDDSVGDLFRWTNVTSQLNSTLADNWFQSYRPDTAAKWLRENALEYDEVFRGRKIAGVTGGDFQAIVFGVYERFENGIDRQGCVSDGFGKNVAVFLESERFK
jgi:hypothetical protein